MALVRQHLAQLGGVRIGHDPRAAERTFTAARLAREDVALERRGPHELSRSCLLEALGGAPMCLQFRHVPTLSFPPGVPRAAWVLTSSRPVATGWCASGSLPAGGPSPPPRVPPGPRSIARGSGGRSRDGPFLVHGRRSSLSPCRLRRGNARCASS